MKESIITPVDEFDSTKYYTALATNWEADQTASAYADTDRTYISSGRGTVKERDKIEVVNYLNKDYGTSGAEASDRQKFEIQESLGELPEGETAESMMEKAKIDFIEKGKIKLGYRQETKVASKTGDSTRNDDAGGGPRNVEIRSRTANARLSKQVSATSLSVDAMNPSGDPLYSSKSILETSLNPIPGSNSTTNFKRMREKGLFKGGAGKLQFIQYVNNANLDETFYHPVNNAATINAFNDRGVNQRVKKITRIDSKGKRTIVNAHSIGEAIENPAENIVLIPSTGVSTIAEYSRDNEGYLIGKNKRRLKGMDANGSAIDIKDPALWNERASDDKPLHTEKTKKADYNIDFNIMKETSGHFKYREIKELNEDFTVSTDAAYVSTKKITQVNEDGTVEQFEYEIEIEPSDIEQASTLNK